MKYTSIFEKKSSSNNSFNFCRRIDSLIDRLKSYTYGKFSYDLLDEIFLTLPFNNGFCSIQDILTESDSKYKTFKWMGKDSSYASIECILANIDIVINCLVEDKNKLRYPLNENKENYKVSTNIVKACNEFLFSLGLKLYYSGEKYEIVENDISIDLTSITNEELKDDVLSYYNYLNKNNYKNKKEILTNLIIKLEGNRTDIQKLYGKGIEQAIFMYGNSLNLRHDNINQNNKGHFKPAVSKLTEEELIEWYDYVYPLAINTYIYLQKLKDINCTNDFK